MPTRPGVFDHDRGSVILSVSDWKTKCFEHLKKEKKSMFNLHHFVSKWHKSRLDYIQWEYNFETEKEVGTAVL